MRLALRRAGQAVLCAVAMVALAVPSGAAEVNSADDPQTLAFTDAGGDANLINNQGVDDVPLGDEGPDARPASLGSADLIEGRYETTYESVPERDEDGRVLRIRRVPTGLRLSLRTDAPAAPTFGPTISFEVWVSVATCPIIFRMRTHGPLSQPGDPPQEAELRTRSSVCDEGARSYTQGISLDIQGPIAVLDFPFAALATPAGTLLRPGDEIEPDPSTRGVSTSPLLRLPNGLLLGGPIVDKAPAIPGFVIGSDVPPDVDCVESPDHHECIGADA